MQIHSVELRVCLDIVRLAQNGKAGTNSIDMKEDYTLKPVIVTSLGKTSFCLTFNTVRIDCSFFSNSIKNVYPRKLLKMKRNQTQIEIFFTLVVLRRVIAPGQHSFYRRNVAAVTSHWQHCVRFDRSKILRLLRSSDLPPHRRMPSRSTNWPC